MILTSSASDRVFEGQERLLSAGESFSFVSVSKIIRGVVSEIALDIISPFIFAFPPKVSFKFL